MSNQAQEWTFLIVLLFIALGLAGLGLWLGAKIFIPLYRRLGRRTLWVGLAAIVVLTFFYPPWIEGAGAFGGGKFLGYFWLWSPPLDQYGRDTLTVHIDYWLLLLEWLAIALVSALLWLAFRE